MGTFLVTFPVGGPLSDCYTSLEAADETEARRLVVEAYRRAWGAVYPERDKARVVDKYNLRHIPFGNTVGSLMAALETAVAAAKAAR